ncbi:UDP-glucuronosyltransferase 2A2-like isoform X2 [Poecilia reticulata]|uniref:UDP-glucuronosyltransferase 2A2-like isoform X2 n=1 Tax=Poecilia reticulata TaxID=8081 RepID=UPI0007E99EFC|nr:PREDICTED: UDP-glucuronosyltransferase 2A2-like isoform X2 [Poecilia reticulata]
MKLHITFFVLLLLSAANGGKILVWHTDGSHWINMKPVLETLVDRGHQVTVLVPSTSMFMNSSEPSRFRYEPFNVSVSMEFKKKFIEEFLLFSIYEVNHMSYLQIYNKFIGFIRTNMDYFLKFLHRVVKSETIMKKLKKGNYDVLFADPIYPGRTPTSACELMGKADIWLMRTYWDFDFPRPLLPNFKFVGGIHCKPAKPLPEEMEKFVQSSGDAGIVVFSLGSMVKNLTTEKANMIASALAQLPQKVLWRYSGEKPKGLGSNTRIYDWIPQNDLLGHPKTKAFITHGGTNGIYEAIYHGVPMVGIPMFGDQPDNMVHMEAKGAAVTAKLKFMTNESLRDAVNTVINDKSYKENVMRLSRIHHDRPMSPRDEAVFWIEFTMRNKGAKHLRVQAHKLTWYQYHSLDVLAFLLIIDLLLIFILFKSCSFCFKRCCSRKKTKRKAE